MHNNSMFYGLFLALALVVASAAGFSTAQAQNDTTTMTSQLTNLTNATTSPEEVKQMDVIGGTVNGTLNATSGNLAGITNLTNTTSP
jgi:hypothetical protein